VVPAVAEEQVHEGKGVVEALTRTMQQQQETLELLKQQLREERVAQQQQLVESKSNTAERAAAPRAAVHSRQSSAAAAPGKRRKDRGGKATAPGHLRSSTDVPTAAAAWQSGSGGSGSVQHWGTVLFFQKAFQKHAQS